MFHFTVIIVWKPDVAGVSAIEKLLDYLIRPSMCAHGFNIEKNTFSAFSPEHIFEFFKEKIISKIF
jgi:hypothetical protein